jgi:signal transduction histidine kinase
MIPSEPIVKPARRRAGFWFKQVHWGVPLQTNTAVTPGFITMTTSGLSNDPVQKIKEELTRAAQADDLVACLSEMERNQSDIDISAIYQALGKRIQKIHGQHVETLEKVTHDLRSLTASILGYADLLADTQFRCDENILNSCHQTIIQQGERVGRLMDQTVIMAYLETGCMQVKRSSFSITNLLESLIAETCEQSERQICFQNQIGKAVIYGDPLFLRMAILNLIDNGLRYSPAEQSLEVILHPASTPGWIQLDVKDQGIGIDPGQQDILFTRFGRIKNIQNRKSVGSGMGLYLVKIIIQEHRGTVKVKSQPGHGSTFSIGLPVNAIS